MAALGLNIGGRYFDYGALFFPPMAREIAADASAQAGSGKAASDRECHTIEKYWKNILVRPVRGFEAELLCRSIRHKKVDGVLFLSAFYGPRSLAGVDHVFHFGFNLDFRGSSDVLF